jgi:hypothetical protein
MICPLVIFQNSDKIMRSEAINDKSIYHFLMVNGQWSFII